ncbi:TPA: IpaD/SipD/SspD family type III secretion system needle tip protein, partial [Escherichia coli]
KIDENYMDVYEHAIQTYMNFFSDFADAISEMSKFITSYKDENYPITINYIGLFALFNNLYETYAFGEAGVLFSSNSLQEAEQWADEWGLEVSNNDGIYEVRIDMTPITSIMDGIATLFSPDLENYTLLKKVTDILSNHNVDINDNDAVAEALKNGDIKKEIEEVTKIKDYNDLYFSSAEYQAFQAGFDAQEQIIQTTMQTMTQKYNTAVSLVDNLYKILSSTISSCTETLKAYLTN